MPRPAPLIDTAAVTALATLVGVIVTLAWQHHRMKRELADAHARLRLELQAAADRSAAERQHAISEAALERDHARSEATREREHSANEAQLERILKARLAIYSDIVDGFVELQGMFARLPNTDLTNAPDLPIRVQAFSANVNKTLLISEIDTALKARELAAQIQTSFMGLVWEAVPIQRLNSHVRSFEANILAEQGEIERIDSELRQLRLMGRTDPELGHALVALRRSRLESIAKLREEVVNANAQIQPLLKKFLAALFLLQREQVPYIDALIAATRSELGMVGDVEQLNLQTLELQERMAAGLAELLAKVEGG